MKLNTNSNSNSNIKQNLSIRIIGGQYKRSKIEVSNVEGLRPTPDRLRETLFNWLGDISNTKCLDAFAGTGILGLECISRYATHVTFIENNKLAYLNLQKSISKLKLNLNIIETPNYKVSNNSAIEYLDSLNTIDKFDVIFLDPPYQHNILLRQSIEIIMRKSILKTNGIIYIEHCDKEILNHIVILHKLEVRKQGKMGQIHFMLLSYKTE
jgi:16S rRNA (guanine966-N2)-methyltransferase